jgi:tetratricopeptide (TPR) repeat protein
MKRQMLWSLGASCVVLACTFSAQAGDAKPVAPAAVVDGFLKSLGQIKELPEAKAAEVADAVKALAADPDGQAIAITEALRELSPEFRAGLLAIADEDVDAAAKAFEPLRRHANPYLAAEATYFLARAYLLNERYEDTLPLLAELDTKLADKTVRAGEATFLTGVAEAQLLHHQKAIDALKKFVADYPGAPERMRVGAFRQLEALKLFEEGTLTDAQLRMEFSRRKLAIEDTGKETREQQDKIIQILAKLIKEAEERECNCKGGKCDKPGQKSGQGKGNESEGQAKGEGNQGGEKGGGSKGIDSDVAKRLHRGGPQSPWSKLRDKERDPVFAALKEKFPARYQDLIEQYYKSFQDEEGR